MIADNNLVNKQEIVTFIKDRLIQTIQSRTNVFRELGQEHFDYKKNGEQVSMNPMYMRDDYNLNDTAIMNKLNSINEDGIIQLEDIIQLCKEIYKYIIRIGKIYYLREYQVNNSHQVQQERYTDVIFNNEFLISTNYANYNNYNKIYNNQNNLNFERFNNQPITDASIFQIIDETIQFALSQDDAFHNIYVSECHDNCHSDSCNCHDKDDSCDCYKSCHRISADDDPDTCDCWH